MPDVELRESLKRDNKEHILPKYQAFYDKYSGVPFAKTADKYVKYTPATVSSIIDTFFDVAAWSIEIVLLYSLLRAVRIFHPNIHLFKKNIHFHQTIYIVENWKKEQIFQQTMKKYTKHLTFSYRTLQTIGTDTFLCYFTKYG